jgi:hypothetical protein
VTIRSASIAVAATLGLVAVLCAALGPARRAARLWWWRRFAGSTSGRRRFRVGSVLAGFVAAVLVVLHVLSGSAVVGLAASAMVVASAALKARPLVGVLARRSRRSTSDRWRGRTVRGRQPGCDCRDARRSRSRRSIGLGTVVWLWTARRFEQSVLEVMPGVRGEISGELAESGRRVSRAPLDDAIVGELKATGVAAVVGEQTADRHYAGGPSRSTRSTRPTSTSDVGVVASDRALARSEDARRRKRRARVGELRPQSRRARR